MNADSKIYLYIVSDDGYYRYRIVFKPWEKNIEAKNKNKKKIHKCRYIYMYVSFADMQRVCCNRNIIRIPHTSLSNVSDLSLKHVNTYCAFMPHRCRTVNVYYPHFIYEHTYKNINMYAFMHLYVVSRRKPDRDTNNDRRLFRTRLSSHPQFIDINPETMKEIFLFTKETLSLHHIIRK